MVYIANITELDYLRKSQLACVEELRAYLQTRNDESEFLELSLAFEQKLYDLEKQGLLTEYFALHGDHLSAIPTLYDKIYTGLRILHYYSITNEEVKKWALRKGNTVVDAASRKDMNIAQYFIRAEVIAFDDFQAYEADTLKLNMDGRIKTEGRRYVVNDGDILDYLHHPFAPY
jgi:ribosome-binding ATPase